MKNLFNSHFSKDIFSWLLGFAAVFAYVYPWILAGESGYIRIHDSLDSNMAWIKILTESNFWFAPSLSQVGPIAEHGMPRIVYPRELNVITWIFAIFDPYWAYVSNQFVLRIVAFSGMYIFLKSIIQQDQNARSIIVLGVSLCYAFLPFFAWTGSVASLPFIFYALFRIWRGYIGKTEIIILILHPFYSSTVFTGMFIIGIFWLLTLIKYLKHRQMSPLILGALIITAAYLVVDYRLWSHLFFGEMIPHRVDMIYIGSSFSDAWVNAKQIFFKGDWAVTLHNLVILKVTSVALVLICINLIWTLINTKTISFILKSKSWQQVSRLLFLIFLISFIIFLYSGHWTWPYSEYWKYDTAGIFRHYIPGLVFLQITSAALIFTSIYFIWVNFSTRISARITTLVSWNNFLRSGFSVTKSEPWPQGLILTMAALFVFSIAISFYAAFWDWSTVVLFRQKFSILMQVNFTRLTFFLPFIWMVTFALSLVVIVRIIRIPIISVFLVTLLIGLQLKIELDNHEYKMEEKESGITFSQFYSEKLFEQIEKSLPDNKKSYVVGSIGIHPSILQYNGFRTADGYLNFYPKEYKLKFRKAVINEFSKNEFLLSYFDDWGSRFYFFSSEMICPRSGALCVKNSSEKYANVKDPQVIKNFDLDIPATRALGVKYLFSVTIISNAEDLGLKSMGAFSSVDSPWPIIVYKIADK